MGKRRFLEVRGFGRRGDVGVHPSDVRGDHIRRQISGGDTGTLEYEKDFLKECQTSRNRVQISAFVDGKLAGNASVEPVSERIKMCHRADFGIAVLEEYWGLGLGNALTFACLAMAKKMGFTQIELNMLEKNEKGRRLYEKAGFREWGRLKNSFRLKDGTFETGVSMVKELGN